MQKANLSYVIIISCGSKIINDGQIGSRKVNNATLSNSLSLNGKRGHTKSETHICCHALEVSSFTRSYSPWNCPWSSSASVEASALTNSPSTEAQLLLLAVGSEAALKKFSPVSLFSTRGGMGCV